MEIGVAASQDLDTWSKVGELTPVTEPELPGICAPGAVVLEGKVHLFYQNYGRGRFQESICHAVSADGVTFARDSSNPVFAPQGDWTNGRAIDADVIVHDGRLFMFYATRDPAAEVQMLGVAAAPLASGFGAGSWTQLGTGPILAPELDWEMPCIEAPAVCRHGDRLFMFYGGAWNNSPQQIGCAASIDGVVWRRLRDQPFLPNGRPDEWNASESGHPFIFTDDDGTTHLFHQGNNDGGKTWYLSRRTVVWESGLPGLA